MGNLYANKRKRKSPPRRNLPNAKGFSGKIVFFYNEKSTTDRKLIDKAVETVGLF